jgi:hypothetical protein
MTGLSHLPFPRLPVALVVLLPYLALLVVGIVWWRG